MTSHLSTFFWGVVPPLAAAAAEGGGTPPRKHPRTCFEESVALDREARRERALLLDIATTSNGAAQLLTDGLTDEEKEMKDQLPHHIQDMFNNEGEESNDVFDIRF